MALLRASLLALLIALGGGCHAADGTRQSLCTHGARLAGIGEPGPALPKLAGRVVDQADLFDAAEEQKLSDASAALERRTGDQLVVVTTGDLQGRSIEEYGRALGNGWGIGRKGVDDGVLLIIAPSDRKVRIEVGCGLEGLLTDARAKRIVDERLLPELRRGDYPAAAEAGVSDIVAILQSNPHRPIPRPEKTDP